MRAIVDCDSFYCSCERVFRPGLNAKPVVVLSNNDGCIISRTDEAKKLGIGMAGPYFSIKKIIEENNVAVFSSNYHLYSDMSRRVMEIIKSFVGNENVEVYSIDESFLNLDGFSFHQLQQIAFAIRSTIMLHTGIHVSIGIAPTKTLAKVASHLAKKNKAATNCIAILDTKEKITETLKKTPHGDLWGVGRQYAAKLTALGIATAFDLHNLSQEWARTHLGGVVGVRLIKELHGEEAIMMHEQLVNKKNITTSRMFGNPVSELSNIKEAIATYISRAAEKLRRQHSAANILRVYIVPKEKTDAPGFRHGPTLSKHVLLPYPTSITGDLIKAGVKMAEELFEEGKKYVKGGIILGGLVPDDSIQGNFFESEKNNRRSLMHMLDNINFSMRDDIVKFASSGLQRNWKMRQELRSPRYTTRWNELHNIR